MRALLLSGLVALATAACWTSPALRKTDLASEAAAVRSLNSNLNDAIQRRDTQVVVAAYAPDGALLWQNDPRITGPGIRNAWAQAFGTPGFALRLHSQVVRVAEAGDYALDEGSLELEVPGPGGILRSAGKYLVVWRKVNGAWKILYDVYNTDAPPTARAASDQ